MQVHLARLVLEEQVEQPGRDVDRLVLLDVVLQAQLMALDDVDRLPQVRICDRPADLVPPGLVDTVAAGRMNVGRSNGLAHGSATPTWVASALTTSSTRSLVDASLYRRISGSV